MNEEEADEELMRKARTRALQQKLRRPVTPLGVKMNMQLTIARLAVQDLDRKARETLWSVPIEPVIRLLLGTLRDIEHEIMEWELSQ